MPMLGLLALVVAASPAVTSREVPIFLSIVQRGDFAPLQRAIAAAIHSHTDLAYAASPELDAELAFCPEDTKLQCSTRAVLRYAKRDEAFLLVVTPYVDAQKIASLVLDVARARRIIDEGGATEEELEDRIFSKASLSCTDTYTGALEDVSAESFPVLAHRSFRSVLATSGHYVPNGELLVYSNLPGLIVELDGTATGTTVMPGGAVKIEQLREGKLILSLRDPSGTYTYAPSYVTVAHGKVVDVRAHAVPILAATDGPPVAEIRTTIFGVGAAGAITGAALLVYALAGDLRVKTVRTCHEGTCGDRASLLASFADYGDGTGSPDIYPGLLGAALLTTGAAWTGGLFFEDDLPIYSFVGGALAGLALYGVVAVAAN